MNNQTLTRLANQIVALRNAPSPNPQPLTYKSGGNTSAMIALFLPTSTGTRFIQSDSKALPPNELHITLAYLGKVDDLSLRQVKETHDLMRLISEKHPPLTGHINGYGRFCNGDDDGDPFFIIPDLAALPNLRELIVIWLKGNNIEVASDHGFVPHITLTYLPHAERNPFDILERTPISFRAISLVLGDDRYNYPLTQGVSLLNKAALIEKIGARHTMSEAALVQKMHDLTLGLGAECHPLTRRAGARHSNADQTLVQRIHDDCAGLGAVCKAVPEKDTVYSSQVLKEGNAADYQKGGLLSKEKYSSLAFGITKAQSDAPNYKPASTPQRCANCRFFFGDPGRDWCDLFDFTADQDFVCDAWEAQRPDEIPGYVANKGDLVQRNWENSTPAQRKGRDAVNNAIKAGILKRASTKICFRCRNRPGAEYHHVDGYAEGKVLNVRAVCFQCHSVLTRKADLATLTEEILTLRGGATSGNWRHAGRKGKRGGSGGGGGFGRIGVKPGSKPSRKKVQAAAKKKQAKPKPKTQTKPKAVVKKPAAKPKVQATTPTAGSKKLDNIFDKAPKSKQNFTEHLMDKMAKGEISMQDAQKLNARFATKEPAAKTPIAKKKPTAKEKPSEDLKPGKGRKVSEGLNLAQVSKSGKSGAAVHDTVDIINSVHSDGNLSKIPVELHNPKNEQGSFVNDPINQKAKKINVNRNGTHPHMTAAHEIGHNLDYQAIGQSGEFSESTFAFGRKDAKLKAKVDAVYTTLDSSDAAKTLKSQTQNRTVEVKKGNKTLEYKTDKKYANYLLEKREMFARGYAQYIATKSDDKKMLKELDGLRRADKKAKVSYPRQWSDSDFKAISKSFDDLFSEMKWIE